MTMLPRVFGIRRVCSHLWSAAGFWADIMQTCFSSLTRDECPRLPVLGGLRSGYAAKELWEASLQKTPCSIMASATRLKPAILAPATRL